MKAQEAASNVKQEKKKVVKRNAKSVQQKEGTGA
jgi:hypothetical protein